MKKIIAMMAAVAAVGGRAEEQNWVKELVPDAVGTRVTQYWLFDTSRTRSDSFLGSIDELRAEEDYLPTKLFAQWNIGRFAYVEATWDKMEVDAESQHGRGDSDGKIEASGPILTLNGRLPNETRFTPFAGIGIAPWSATFDHADWHHYGFDSVADWKSVGSPQSPRNGKVRHITAEDTVGFVATVGLDVALGKGWVLDIYGRYMDISTDYHFTVDVGGDTRTNDVKGSFPLDNFAAGIGLARQF